MATVNFSAYLMLSEKMDEPTSAGIEQQSKAEKACQTDEAKSNPADWLEDVPLRKGVKPRFQEIS
jgi:hypothetical protein